VPPSGLVRARVDERGWLLRGRGPCGAEIELEGDDAGTVPHPLPVPLPAERRVVGTAQQHLAGHVRVAVRRRGRPLFQGESRLAGLERGHR